MRSLSSSVNSFADELHVEQCHAFVVHHLKSRRDEEGLAYPPKQGPAITITHQVGAGAREVALRVSALLREDELPGTAPWTAFDRELVEAVLAEHNLPAALAPQIREEHRSFVRDVLEEIFELRPPSWVMTPKIKETTLRLAQAGNVILLGHCANYITQSMPNVFHVRLIAPLDTRVERLRLAEGQTEAEALEAVRADDRERRLSAKQNYHHRIDDDLLYDMVINTERVSFDQAAELIANAARQCFVSDHAALASPP